MNPTLFISHGAPNIILSDIKSKQNIKKLADSLEKPKYIIIFSAHYLTKDLKSLVQKQIKLCMIFTVLKMNYIK